MVWESDLAALERLVGRYPWFTTARRARALLAGRNDPALILPLMFSPTIAPVSKPFAGAVSAASVAESAEPENRVVKADEIIDKFLQHGDYKIVPRDDIETPATGPDTETSAADIDFDPEMATEELAEIYRAQGLVEEAEKIYNALHLRNS